MSVRRRVSTPLMIETAANAARPSPPHLTKDASIRASSAKPPSAETHARCTAAASRATAPGTVVWVSESGPVVASLKSEGSLARALRYVRASLGGGPGVLAGAAVSDRSASGAGCRAGCGASSDSKPLRLVTPPLAAAEAATWAARGPGGCR